MNVIHRLIKTFTNHYIQTVMVNNSPNINKTNNKLSPPII